MSSSSIAIDRNSERDLISTLAEYLSSMKGVNSFCEAVQLGLKGLAEVSSDAQMQKSLEKIQKCVGQTASFLLCADFITGGADLWKRVHKLSQMRQQTSLESAEEHSSGVFRSVYKVVSSGLSWADTSCNGLGFLNEIGVSNLGDLAKRATVLSSGIWIVSGSLSTIDEINKLRTLFKSKARESQPDRIREIEKLQRYRYLQLVRDIAVFAIGVIGIATVTFEGIPFLSVSATIASVVWVSSKISVFFYKKMVLLR